MLLTITRIFFYALLWVVPVSGLKAQPVKVEIRREGKDFVLYREGKPYFIQGVAADDNLPVAAALGANSVRISHQDLAPAVLDAAAANGLTVTVVLRIPSREQGFDASNAARSAELVEAFNSIILAHKNHPALLMWATGFEVNRLEQGSAIWPLINNLAKLCHVLDPNHPVMTIFGGISKEDVHVFKKQLPDVDVLGINTYGALEGLPSALRAWSLSKPYILTEWGSTAERDVPKTSWDAPVEQHSTEKANSYRRRYEDAIAVDVRLCLGSYAGFWGNRFSATPTWYGLFLPTGEALGGIDVLESLFTRKPPANQAPEITSMKMTAATAYDNVIISVDGEYSAWVQASDPDGDSLAYRWEVLADTFFYAPPVTRPVPLENLFVNNFGQRISFRSPEKTGMYRLYVYIYDRRGKAATSNIPFFVN